MSARDRDIGAALLRRLREARGWSWGELARALRGTARSLGVSSSAGVQTASIQRSVARWESLSSTVGPSERNQLLLAHLYARTPAGEVLLDADSDFDVLLTALHHFGVEEARLAELRVVVAEAAAGSGEGPTTLPGTPVSSALARVLHDPSRLDRGAIAELQRTVSGVDHQVGIVPFVRLRLRIEPVAEWCRRLTATDTPIGLRDDLLLVASRTFTLAGRLAFETRDDAASRAWYGAAVTTAGMLSDSWYLAAALVSRAMVMQYTTGGLADARESVRAAVVAAERGSSITVRARALAVTAELSARSGLGREADIALHRAWKTIDRHTVGDPNGEFGSDRLDGFEGVCRLHNGRPGSAAQHIERCIGGLQSARSIVQLGINTTDLALARGRLGDPRASTELLHKSVEIAAGTGGRVIAQRIRQGRRELHPWRTESFVADLDDHIHDALLDR